MVTDNHDLQILHLLKYTARHLQNKNHQQLLGSKVFSPVLLWQHGRLWACTLLQSYNSRVGELSFDALLHKGLRSETYCSLFPSLQPRKVIQLWEELLLLNYEHKHGTNDTSKQILRIYNWVWLTYDSKPPWRSQILSNFKNIWNCFLEFSMNYQVQLSINNKLNKMVNIRAKQHLMLYENKVKKTTVIPFDNINNNTL